MPQTTSQSESSQAHSQHEPHPEAEARTDSGSEAPPTPEGDLTGAIEAMLLTSDRPIAPAKIAEVLVLAGVCPEETATPKAVEGVIRDLNARYEQAGCAFRIEQVAGGWRVMTLPEYSGVLAAFGRLRTPTRLSRAAVETLAIIAYRQPITRAKLESIRGVACGEVAKTLMERRLVAIVGRAEELGRPMLYGTTKHFLDTFGLASIKDLPATGELPIPEEAPVVRATVADDDDEAVVAPSGDSEVGVDTGDSGTGEAESRPE
ncbi:MAG: SMC-Scp complex subunit ScpB [Phycisphaerales bacterium]|nr:MAG: SMC-Scp complex subunit ScpB [Phycisphaerales bacterium]